MKVTVRPDAFWSSWASQSNTVFLKANASASSTAYWSSWTSQCLLKPTASSSRIAFWEAVVFKKTVFDWEVQLQ